MFSRSHASQIICRFHVVCSGSPFPAEATVTLHGDRWDNIELPFVGAKCLVLSNQGGLGSTNVHSRIGRLDLHGLPHKNFVHLKGTHKVGALELVVEEAVDWQPGEELVLMNPWEEVRFASIFLVSF